MKKLNYELKNLVWRTREGSYSTQSDRHRYLQLIAKQLKILGYRNMGMRSLKKKHVGALVRHWQTEISKQTGKPISNATIKNRMSAIRWWALKINKANVVPRTNKELGIGDRRRLPIKDKAFTLTEQQKEVLPKYLNLSVRLQQEFGLRREASSKFISSLGQHKDHIRIVSSWTKGGRERIIPITNDKQRELLDEIKAFAPNNSLIPAQMSFRKYLSHRRYVLDRAGIPPTHGLRYHYAQRRYLELSDGLKPPRLSGLTHSKLNDEEKKIDLAVRKLVSAELGHGRIDITRVYLG